MDSIKKNWFSEKDDLWPGQCLSLKIDHILYEGKSRYQNILVLQTTNHGRVLILDGIIQCTEFDEFIYQEMITFLPLNSHPKPRRVLIIGGGDGGVVREATKHPLVEEIVHVEIDEEVIEVSKKFLPFLSKGFESDKLTLKICDGFEFLKENQRKFDVIITDSSDPIGPAKNLFTSHYFELLKNSLNTDGIICSQAGTVWSGEFSYILDTFKHCKNYFPQIFYTICNVPTYPTGQIGFILASLDDKQNFQKINLSDDSLNNLNLKYYNYGVHKGAFLLPNFVKQQFSLIKNN